jgi:hypothetical protein
MQWPKEKSKKGQTTQWSKEKSTKEQTKQWPKEKSTKEQKSNIEYSIKLFCFQER